MMAMLMVALVVIGVIVAIGLVALVIMLRDAWRDRRVTDEDDWVGDEDNWKGFFGGTNRGGCAGGGF